MQTHAEHNFLLRVANVRIRAAVNQRKDNNTSTVLGTLSPESKGSFPRAPFDSMGTKTGHSLYAGHSFTMVPNNDIDREMNNTISKSRDSIRGEDPKQDRCAKRVLRPHGRFRCRGGYVGTMGGMIPACFAFCLFAATLMHMARHDT